MLHLLVATWFYALALSTAVFVGVVLAQAVVRQVRGLRQAVRRAAQAPARESVPSAAHAA